MQIGWDAIIGMTNQQAAYAAGTGGWGLVVMRTGLWLPAVGMGTGRQQWW